ncbi:MAG: cupin domain-containing protein [Candidatus Eremiobacteraeota bacterium]|nr:cupin domain-containing protein [Candidatus Eremiobacteraeota bacterium]
MKQRLFLAFVLMLASPLAVSASPPTIVLPTNTHWTAMTSGPMAGAQMAILMGNPSKPGPYIMRVKVKDGTKFAPHFHGELENVTVISGTLMVGLGDKMNTAKMKAIPAGGFVSVPSGLHHYAMAKGETVLEIAAMGPRTMIGVMPHK